MVKSSKNEKNREYELTFTRIMIYLRCPQKGTLAYLCEEKEPIILYALIAFFKKDKGVCFYPFLFKMLIYQEF